MPHYVVDKVAEALNTRRKAVNGSQGAGRRRRLQARHRRHARVAGARRDGAAAREGRPGLVRRSRTCPTSTRSEWSGGYDDQGASTLTRGSFGQYDCVVIVTDHRSFDYDAHRRGGGPHRRHPQRDQGQGPSRVQARGAAAGDAAHQRHRLTGLRLARCGGSVCHRAPDHRQARDQLMVVVQQVELDARARPRPTAPPSPDHGGVATTLEDLDRLGHDARRARRSAAASSYSPKWTGIMPAETVVEDVQDAGAAPFVEPRSPRSRSRFAEKSRAGASRTSRSTRRLSRRAACTATNAAEARPDEGHRSGRQALDQLRHLREHARDRQRLEVRLVEVGRDELAGRARQPARRSTPPSRSGPTRRSRGGRRGACLRAWSGTPGGSGTGSSWRRRSNSRRSALRPSGCCAPRGPRSSGRRPAV